MDKIENQLKFSTEVLNIEDKKNFKVLIYKFKKLL
jgi:hypothetical protein